MLQNSHYDIGHALMCLCKSAGEAELSYGLSGRLYFSKSGWLLLSVPNAIGRGAFDALNEPGLEFPGEPYNAHISVFSPQDIAKIGGPDKVTERGHSLNFNLGPIRTAPGQGYNDISRHWFISVVSPDLEKLRRSYGLSSTPGDNDFPFHIAFAVRRRHVLRENDLSKKSSLIHDLDNWRSNPGPKALVPQCR